MYWCQELAKVQYRCPLIFLRREVKWTLALGLREFKHFEAGAIAYCNQMMTASTLMLLRVLIIFLLAQRYFIDGVTLTVIKG